MRLHRISLLNLNSLYGEQVLDLDSDLSGASLFLIHGPTGAGKSTLMDAVSLALFGKTPRLDARRGEADADPCSVMSRGTAECRAEVEFSRLAGGGERVRYRAVWAARRARRQPGGKLQKPERSLERQSVHGDWETVVSGSKKAVVDKAFNEALDDFSADDFQRSMLLAQGRFDELLNATPEQRARILERLTDTSEYKQIGDHAAKLAGAHRKHLEFLRRDLNNAEPVNKGELERALEHARQARQELDGKTAQFDSARFQRDWWTKYQVLRDGLEELGVHRRAIHSEQAHHAEVLMQVAEHERCLRGFDALDGLEAIRGGVARNRAEGDKVRGAYQAACEHATDTAAVRATDSERFGRARELLDRVKGPVAAFNGLRPDVDAAEQKRDEWVRELAVASANHDSKLEEAAAVDGDVAQARDAAARAKQTLAACASATALRDRWNEQLRDGLIRLENALSDNYEQRRSLDARQETHAKELAESIKRREEHERHKRTRLAEPERVLTASKVWIESLCGDDDPAAHLEGQHAAAERARALVVATRDARREIAASEAAVRAVKEQAADMDRAKTAEAKSIDIATRARGAVGHAKQRHDDATTQVHRLSLVGEIAQRRGALRRGNECPLCGSSEHPYIDEPERCPDERVLRAQLGAAEADLKQRGRGAEVAEESARSAELAAAARKSERQGAENALERARMTLGEQTTSARIACQQATLSESCVGVECEQMMDLREQALSELNDGIKTLGNARETLADAERGFEAVTEELRVVEDTCNHQSLTLHTRGLELQHSREVADERRHRLDEDLKVLGVALRKEGVDTGAETGMQDSGQVVAPESGPAAWRRQAERLIDALDRAEVIVAETQTHARVTCVKRDAAAQAVADAGAGLERARKSAAEHAQHLVALNARSEGFRAKALSTWSQRLENADGQERQMEEPTVGLSPAEVLDQATEFVRHFEVVALETDTKARVADGEVKKLSGEIAALGKAMVALHAGCVEAEERLMVVLNELGLGAHDVLRDRRMDAHEHRAGMERAKSLASKRSELQTRTEERQRAMEEHVQIRPGALEVAIQSAQNSTDSPEGDVGARGLTDQLAVAVELAEFEQESAAQANQASQISLSNVRRRQQVTALSGERLRLAEEEAAVWLRLDKLIGTRSGGIFQEFAQGLNLHRLIQKANVHLGRLSERYRLTQGKKDGVPSLDFAIDDLWQVGEPRSPRSLSGGERFLVSLALALGLSDLRTQSLPIETLLLDEGFGTLDPETLETALAALQQLQADGRQVGIISHVSGLRDRIEAQVRVEELGGGRSRIRVGRSNL